MQEVELDLAFEECNHKDIDLDTPPSAEEKALYARPDQEDIVLALRQELEIVIALRQELEEVLQQMFKLEHATVGPFGDIRVINNRITRLMDKLESK